jgi:hypothetical protein
MKPWNEGFWILEIKKSNGLNKPADLVIVWCTFIYFDRTQFFQIRLQHDKSSFIPLPQFQQDESDVQSMPQFNAEGSEAEEKKIQEGFSLRL